MNGIIGYKGMAILIAEKLKDESKKVILSRCATEIDAMIANANYPSFNKHSKRSKSDRKRNKQNRWR